MKHSLSEDLQRDMSCEELLGCFYDLGDLEVDCWWALLRTEEKQTVDELAEQVNRERSTTYRAVQRLLDEGLVRKEQINYDDGGYYHVYAPTDPGDIAREMQAMLNERYGELEALIHRFETSRGITV